MEQVDPVGEVLGRDDVAVLVGGVDAGGAVAITLGVVFGECPDEAWAGFAAAAFDDPDECVADVAEVDPLAAAVFPGLGAEVELLVQRPQLLEPPWGVRGTVGTGSPKGSWKRPAGLTVQPSSWTRRWWRRQSRIRFASSVGPPSAQCSRWCASSPRVFVQPGKRQQPSRAFSARRSDGGTARVLRPTPSGRSAPSSSATREESQAQPPHRLHRDRRAVLEHTTPPGQRS